jgi:hypothetical protein
MSILAMKYKVEVSVFRGSESSVEIKVVSRQLRLTTLHFMLYSLNFLQNRT